MRMERSISTHNNIVIESLRKYVAFLIGLKSILLSFIEERSPRTGGNIVARIAYGVMAGSLLLQIARDEFINLYEALSSGRIYKAPRKVDFSTYIRCVCSSISEGSSEHDNKWDKYLQKLMREDMCNRTAVAYSIPYDASTHRIYGHETFVWMLSKLPPRFVSMFLSDTYYKRMGFDYFFNGKGNSSDIEKVIDDSCLRTGFIVFLGKMKQELELMEKRNQEASLSDLYSFVSTIGESVSGAVEDLRNENKTDIEMIKNMIKDIGLQVENTHLEEDSKETMPSDAWKEMPFYQACRSIGAIFDVAGVDDYMAIESVEKYAKKIIEYLKKGSDEKIKSSLSSIPSNEELARTLRSKKKGAYIQLKATSFNQNMTEARRMIAEYIRISSSRKKEKSPKEVSPKANRFTDWNVKYNKK